MKTIQLTKILNFKRTLAAAALALATLAYATPGRAMPHIVTFDFSAPGDCSASIFDVAAKYSSCTLKAEAKAAKRGVEPNLAACDAKVTRWVKKSEKACCSDSVTDPEAHEACVDAVDTHIVDIAGDPSEDATCIPGLASQYEPRNVITADCRDANDLTTQSEAACCNSVTGPNGGSCSIKSVHQSAFCYSEMCSCDSPEAQELAKNCLQALDPDDRLDPTFVLGE
jgi:hypothetical protein